MRDISHSKYLILKSLKETIDSRVHEDVDKSYTASLLVKGKERCAKKLGEEAVETIIAALGECDTSLVSESADLIYHLLVLLKSRKIDFTQVLDELAKRQGISGLEEKQNRNTKAK